MKIKILLICFAAGLQGISQVSIKIPNTSAVQQVRLGLFGVNTANMFDQISESDMTDPDFINLVEMIGPTSFYYPGGSNARLYNYSDFPGFGYHTAIYGYQTCQEQESDLTGGTSNYTSDSSATSVYFDRQILLGDYNGDNIFNNDEPGLTLSANMYFDRTNADLSGMLNAYKSYYTSGLRRGRIDAIILGTEIAKDWNAKSGTYDAYYSAHSADATLMNGLGSYTTYSSSCGGVNFDKQNQLDGYEQESDYKLLNATNTIGDLLKNTYGFATIYNNPPGASTPYSNIPIAFSAIPPDNSNSNLLYWNINGPISGGCISGVPGYFGSNTGSHYFKRTGACNLWWLNDESDETSIIGDINQYFTGGGTDDLSTMIAALDDNYSDLFVTQWGIKNFKATYDNTMAAEIYTLKRILHMIDYNRNHSSFQITAAYYQNLGNQNNDLIHDDGDSDWDVDDISSAGDAFVLVKPIQKQRYGNSLNHTTGTTTDVENFDSYYFNPDCNECFTIYLINYSGITKSLNELKLDNVAFTSSVDIHQISSDDMMTTLKPAFDEVDTSQAITSLSPFSLPGYSITVLSTTCGEEACKLSGQENSAEEVISIYPNPANREITISLSETTLADIEVVNSSGEIVFREKSIDFSIGGDFSINISMLPSGVYIARSIDGTKTISRSFVIER